MEEHQRIRSKRQEEKVNRICRKYNIDIVTDVKPNRKANAKQNTAINRNMPQ